MCINTYTFIYSYTCIQVSVFEDTSLCSHTYTSAYWEPLCKRSCSARHQLFSLHGSLEFLLAPSRLAESESPESCRPTLGPGPLVWALSFFTGLLTMGPCFEGGFKVYRVSRDSKVGDQRIGASITTSSAFSYRDPFFRSPTLWFSHLTTQKRGIVYAYR